MRLQNKMFLLQQPPTWSDFVQLQDHCTLVHMRTAKSPTQPEAVDPKIKCFPSFQHGRFLQILAVTAKMRKREKDVIKMIKPRAFIITIILADLG